MTTAIEFMVSARVLQRGEHYVVHLAEDAGALIAAAYEFETYAP
jgi:hypothetical protein